MISDDPVIIRRELIATLMDWWSKQNRRPGGPRNNVLFEQVREVLLRNRDECERKLTRHRDSNAVLIGLTNEIEDRSGSASVSNPPPQKLGRPTSLSPTKKMEIAKEYQDGIHTGKWRSQTAYLKAKQSKRWNQNQKSAKAWLSALLKWADKQSKELK